MNLLSRFKQYLADQNLSEASIDNYVADIKKFLYKVRPCAAARSNLEQMRNLDKSDFQDYYQYLIDQQIHQATLKRYLSSLRQFGAFLKACGETAVNPSAGLSDINQRSASANALNIKKLLDEFGQFLEKERMSALTIKNYLSDTRQFLAWLAENQQS